MKNLLLSLALLFPVSASMAQDKPVPEKEGSVESVEDKVQRLVKELGADSYQARENAHQELEKIGKPALEALEKALKSADLEVSSRAQELVEKITGEKVQPKSEPGSNDTPAIPLPPGARNGEQQVTEAPWTPDDMKKVLEKLEGFGGLSPQLKESLDSIRKFLEGSENGTPDLTEMGKLFEKLFDRKMPGMPGPNAKPELERIPELDRQITASDIEKELGIVTKPIDETLKRHLFILPRSGNKPPVALRYGLVLEKVDIKGPAFAQGLRPYDIIIFIGDKPAPKISLPGPEVDWNQWRASSLVAGKADQLELLRTKKAYIEVIRDGKPCKVIEVAPLLRATKDAKKDRKF